MRIREQGLFVMGVGRKQTPKAFVNACNVFVYTENLAAEGEPTEPPGTPAGDDGWVPTVCQATEMACQDDGWALLSTVGSHIRNLDPAFDSRSFGYKQLSLLIKSCPKVFKTKESKTKEGPSVVYVRLAD